VLFGIIRKKGKVGANRVFPVVAYSTEDEPLRRYTLYIISSIRFQRCYHVDMTVR
jgi:hypothetical protein